MGSCHCPGAASGRVPQATSGDGIFLPGQGLPLSASTPQPIETRAQKVQDAALSGYPDHNQAMPLNPQQRQQLRSRAHALHPVVITGNAGLSDAVLREIDLALRHHELIKVRLNAVDRDDRRAMAEHVCETQGADLVQLIGKIGVFYRRKPEEAA